MATHRLPIMQGTRPDSVGGVYEDTYDAEATNDVWRNHIWVFTDTATRDIIYGKFHVPKNYVGSANLIVVWTSTVLTNNVEWDMDYRAVGGNDSESLDQSGNQESVNAADVAPSAAHERMEISIALTDGNFAIDDTVLFLFGRDGTDGGDTLVGKALLFDLLFEYADA